MEQKPLAYDLEVEQAFLGLLMTNLILYKDVSSIVYPEHFYAGLHVIIYQTIKNHLDNGQGINIITLDKILTKDATYLEAGGPSYLYSLLNSFPTSVKGQIVEYAKTIKKYYTKRYMATLAQNWERLSLANDNLNIEELVKQVKTDLRSIPYEIDTKDAIHYYTAEQSKEVLEVQDFVQGLLSDSALSVVYGPSNCGKTFFMTDLAFHVALGYRWRDKRVERGTVIYVALEGGNGIKNRIAAFKKHYDVVPDNFAIVPCQVNFLDPNGNINEFIDLLETAKQDMGDIKLVVVDTLSRALAGGNENGPEDMTMLVHHADKIRMATGAHVCFVHHSGKDEAKGSRGHSSLRAAVDTEIEITREEGASYSNVKIAKQREMAMGEDFQFALEVVELGQNKYFETVTSCVVKPFDGPKHIKYEKLMTPLQKFVYEALLSCVDDFGEIVNIDRINRDQKAVTYEHFRMRLEERGTKEFMEKEGLNNKVKSATQAARMALKDMGKINFNRNYLWITIKE